MVVVDLEIGEGEADGAVDLEIGVGLEDEGGVDLRGVVGTGVGVSRQSHCTSYPTTFSSISSIWRTLLQLQV